MGTRASHAAHADRLRRRVTEAGVLDASLRAGALQARASGLASPYRELATTIGEASYRVTDEQVAVVRENLGSDKAVFELVMSASVGAGLRRWDAAQQAIQGADDAAR